jgi:hypothetical protein
VTGIAAQHDEHPVTAPKPPPHGIQWFTRPGWGRVAWMMPLFFGLGVLLGPGIRWLIGYDPVWQEQVWITVELVCVPFGFLAGIGGFDYWLRYASGAPTRPEDHSGHGAKSWRDYFRVNTDHKVIGVQYVSRPSPSSSSPASWRCSSAPSWRGRATSSSTRRRSTASSPCTRR